MSSILRVVGDTQTGRPDTTNVIPQPGARQRLASRMPDPVARRRKQRSELIMLSEGVPIDPGLPPIQLADGFVPRSREDVALRALCVLMTAIKADRMHQTMVLRVVRQYGLANYFSSSEKDFIRELNPADTEKTQFSWRYESAWVLLWALGYVDGLDSPGARCNADLAVERMRDQTTDSFVDGAQLRPIDRILDQADLVYRYRCSLVDMAAQDQSPPAGLNATIVLERYHAFNWLVRYSDRDWDEVVADQC